MSMHKLAAADVDHLLVKAAHTLRQQNVRIAELEADLAARDRKEHAEKIASLAVSRGMMDEDSAEEYASDLASGNDNLDAIEGIIRRGASGVPLGAPLQKTASADETGGSGETDVLTSFLLSSDITG